MSNYCEEEENGHQNAAFNGMDSSHLPSIFSDLRSGFPVTITALNQDNSNIVDVGSESDHGLIGINIQRNAVDMHQMQRTFGMLEEEPFTQKMKKRFKSCCNCNILSAISLITSLFPVIRWLPKYKTEYCIPDIISGFTIAILHIPQGMAYGILASVNPENGLYVSFFPVLIYFLLGTSKHVSIGTFAVISLMLSSAVHNIKSSVPPQEYNATQDNITSTVSSDHGIILSPTNLEIVTSLAMSVGLLQIFMGASQLGAFAVLLSDQLVSGFTTGAAFHVATSQLKDLFGISIGSYSGPLAIIYMYMDIFSNISHSNLATIIVSALALFFLAVVKEQINNRFKEKLKMPIPIDLVVVIIATTVSYFGKFSEKYLIKIMGHIPTGLPNPELPRMKLIPHLLPDTFAIAIVSFAISLSMAKLFAKKHKYDIRATQELLALGAANVFSSFFACYPCSASLSRSLIQERAGGKTQIAGLVSCILLLVVLLAIAPLFYNLPKCILSCIILVALKGMFLQIHDFIRSWKISKLDALVWLVSLSATILLDVTYGLITGVAFSILTVILRTAMPMKTLLGNIAGSDIYLDVKRYTEAQEIPGIKIFHFGSALYFINQEAFKSALFKYVPLVPLGVNNTGDLKFSKGNINTTVHHIIVDCSSFTYLDTSGLDSLSEIMKEYKEVGITVFLAGCSVSMFDLMEKAKFFKFIPYHPFCFPTIHDAVHLCLQ